jgi:hypothetical protein
MARQERETKRYVTWLPFLIDSARWIRRGWYISEKERIPPKSKVLAPLSLVFPVLRVTYERIVAGGMAPPLPAYAYVSNDPRDAAAFMRGPPDTPTIHLGVRRPQRELPQD